MPLTVLPLRGPLVYVLSISRGLLPGITVSLPSVTSLPTWNFHSAPIWLTRIVLSSSSPSFLPSSTNRVTVNVPESFFSSSAAASFPLSWLPNSAAPVASATQRNNPADCFMAGLLAREDDVTSTRLRDHGGGGQAPGRCHPPGTPPPASKNGSASPPPAP